MPHNQSNIRWIKLNMERDIINRNPHNVKKELLKVEKYYQQCIQHDIFITEIRKTKKKKSRFHVVYGEIF